MPVNMNSSRARVKQLEKLQLQNVITREVHTRIWRVNLKILNSLSHLTVGDESFGRTEEPVWHQMVQVRDFPFHKSLFETILPPHWFLSHTHTHKSCVDPRTPEKLQFPLWRDSLDGGIESIQGHIVYPIFFPASWQFACTTISSDFVPNSSVSVRQIHVTNLHTTFVI
jgi:hypothetical protein